MNEKSSPEFLPTFESLGLRVIVRDDLPAVVHGLLIGTIAADAAPTAVTLERLQWWMLDDDAAQEVALIDPVNDAIRGRFISDKRVRGCCALGDDRVIYVEGRSIVSRSIAGDDRRVHCAEAFGEEEFPTAHPLTDGRVVLLNVSLDDERASVRVIELEGTRELRSIELGARPILSGFQGQNIIVRAWGIGHPTAVCRARVIRWRPDRSSPCLRPHSLATAPRSLHRAAPCVRRSFRGRN